MDRRELFAVYNIVYLSRHMGKPTICIGENKDFAVTAKLISAFVFATRIVQFLFYLNPKFQASSSFLCLYRSVCVGPVRKPHCWFFHETARIFACVHNGHNAIISELEVMPHFQGAEISPVSTRLWDGSGAEMTRSRCGYMPRYQ